MALIKKPIKSSGCDKKCRVVQLLRNILRFIYFNQENNPKLNQRLIRPMLHRLLLNQNN